MMPVVRIVSESVITSLGTTPEAHMEKLRQGGIGISRVEDEHFSRDPFYASIVSDSVLEEGLSRKVLPRFEKLCRLAVARALEKGSPAKPGDTLFILSTTKGNIDLLEKDAKKNFGNDASEYLAASAASVASAFGMDHTLVVSNACISGVLAINAGADLLRSGRYSRAVVVGGDIVSAFTVSGFQSFMALGSGPCKPYDKNRDGLNLGEGAAAVVLKREEFERENAVYVRGGASSNDANHISGPSRTGEGLFQSVERTLRYSGKKAGEVEHLNAHGTATLYNDEMESKAFARSGLSDVPMNSYKGALGHTLGAAGLIETVLSVTCLRNGELLPSPGFGELGVPHPLNVIREHEPRPVWNCLKTASGFGGCNAAIFLERT